MSSLKAVKILSVVGARPNFMKIAPLVRAFREFPRMKNMLVHTGQHYSAEMSDVFFRDLEIPTPDIALNVGSGTHATQTAEIMIRFEQACIEQKPDAVLVVGDVNSTAACALVAAKLHIPVIHVEAGLRSFDRTMPEEINRLVTDALSEVLFVTERSGVTNLLNEGKRRDQIFEVGNVMIDSLIYAEPAIRRSTILERMKLQKRGFALVTLHRPSNVDDPESLRMIMNMLTEVRAKMPVVFPVHPRTAKSIREHALPANGVTCCEPLPYVDFLALEHQAAVVLTDSGGIQEETTYLGVPCLTMRANTERPVTVEIGTNTLVNRDRKNIVKLFDSIIDGNYKKGTVPPLWDGKAAFRMATIINERFN
jgi:UDP-N-acetylglucosamine 2-epimerase (non-hydrolysing)